MRRPDKGWIEGKCRGRQDVCNGPNGVLSAAYGQAGSVTSHSAWLSKFARSGFLCETDTTTTPSTDGDCLFIKDSGDCADGTPWVDVPEHERTTFHACWDGGRWVVGESTGFGYEVQSHRLAGLRNRIKYCANLNLGMRDTHRRVRNGPGLTHLRETAVYCR